jgi:hypothetical protein
VLRSNQMASTSRWLRAPGGGSTAPGSDSPRYRASTDRPATPDTPSPSVPLAEGINEPNQVVAADVIVHRLREQRELVALESGKCESCAILARVPTRWSPFRPAFRTDCKL